MTAPCGTLKSSTMIVIMMARMPSLKASSRSFLNAVDGRRTLDVGRWTLDVGRWTLDVGRWTLVPATHQQPITNNQQPTTDNEYPITRHRAIDNTIRPVQLPRMSKATAMPVVHVEYPDWVGEI